MQPVQPATLLNGKSTQSLPMEHLSVSRSASSLVLQAIVHFMKKLHPAPIPAGILYQVRHQNNPGWIDRAVIGSQPFPGMAFPVEYAIALPANCSPD